MNRRERLASRPDRSTIRGPLLLVVALTAIGAVLGGTLTTLTPSQFTVQTKVLVQPLEGNPYSPNAQGSDLTTLETEAQVVISDVVQGDAADELRDRYPDLDLTRGVSATVIPNSQIVQITTRGDSEQTATDVAGALATAYLERRIQQRDEAIDARRRDLTQRIRTVQEQISALRLGGRGDNSPEIRALGGQLLNLRVQAAAITSANSPGIVLDEPRVTSSGLQVSWPIGALAGGLMGLLLAALILVAQQIRRSPIRSVHDVEELGFPWIGTVGSQSDEDGDMALGSTASLILRSGATPLTLALVPLTNGQSVADLAGHLGRHLGPKATCLVISAEGSSSEQPGLSEALAGAASLEDVCHELTPGVQQVSAGQDPAQGRLLLTTPRLAQLLHDAATSYDVIVVASPPGGRPEGRSVVQVCDFWIPVVAFGSSRVDLERSLSHLHDVTTAPLGTLTVQPRGREHSRGLAQPTVDG